MQDGYGLKKSDMSLSVGFFVLVSLSAFVARDEFAGRANHFSIGFGSFDSGERDARNGRNLAQACPNRSHKTGRAYSFRRDTFVP